MDEWKVSNKDGIFGAQEEKATEEEKEEWMDIVHSMDETMKNRIEESNEVRRKQEKRFNL